MNYIQAINIGVLNAISKLIENLFLGFLEDYTE